MFAHKNFSKRACRAPSSGRSVVRPQKRFIVLAYRHDFLSLCCRSGAFLSHARRWRLRHRGLLSRSRANEVSPWQIAAVIATFRPFSTAAVSCRVTDGAMPHMSHLDLS